MPTIVDLLYDDNKTLLNYLQEKGEISLLNNANESFRKSLLLAAGSYFEWVIQEAILDFARENSKAAEPLFELVRNKAIERQYHTYFQWGGNNANSFFGLFGDDFKQHMIAIVKANPPLDGAIRAFLELGKMRNELVHENFATFALEKTSEEIYSLYSAAVPFVDAFPVHLREYSNAGKVN